MISPNGVILNANKAAIKTLGYIKDELIGKSLETIYAPESRQKMKKIFKNWKKNGKVRNEELMIITKTGETRNILLNAESIKDDRGKIIQSISIQRDITELKQKEKVLQETEQKYRNLVENKTDVIFSMDKNGKITYISPVIKTIMGYSPKEIIGKNFLSYVFKKDVPRIDRYFSEVFAGKIKPSIYRLRTKKGNIRWVRTFSRPRVVGNEVIGLDSVLNDVTEQMETEQKLMDSEEKYRRLIETSGEGIATTDAEGKFTYVNNALCKIIGYSKKELIGKFFGDFLHPDEKERILEEFFRAFENPREKLYLEFKLRHKKGHVIHLSSSPTIFRKDGKIAGFNAIIIDITERKRLEEERAREKTLVGTVHAMVDSVIIFDINGVCVYANPQYMKLFGLTEDEFIGKPILEIPGIDRQKPEEVKKFIPLFEEAIEKGKAGPVDLNLVTVDNQEMPVSVAGGTIKNIEGNPTHMIAVVRDISERKRMEEELKMHRDHLEELVKKRTTELYELNIELQHELAERERAEEALRESEERFKKVFEGAPDAMFMADPKSSRILDANPAAGKLLRKPINKIIGLHQSQLHPSQMKKIAKKKFDVHLQQDSNLIPLESKVITSDKKEIPVEIMAQLITITGKQVLLGTFRNITERKQSEEALKASEEQYRNLVSNLTDTIIEIDSNLNFIYVSPQLEKSFGFKPEEIIGTNAFDFIHPDDRPRALKAFEDAMEKGQVLQFEFKAKNKAGNYIDVSGTGKIIENGDDFKIVGIARDITNLKQAENALRESEEMYKTLIKTSPEAVTVTDLKGDIIYVSERTLDLYGFDSPEDMLGKNAMDFIAPEEHNKVLLNIKKTLEKNIVNNVQYTMMKKDKSLFTGELSSSLVKDLNNQPKAFIATARDITKRKQIEKTLKENEKRFRSMFENSSDVIMTLDIEKNVKYITPSIERVFGYKPNNIVGTSAVGYIHPDDLNLAISTISEVIEKPEVPITVQLRFKNDKDNWQFIEATANNLLHIPEINGIVVNFHDITEKRKTFEALQESEEKFRNLAEQSPNMIFINQKGRIVYANKKSEELMGYSRSEFYSPDFNFINLIVPESREIIRNIYNDHINGKEINQPLEYSMITKDGKRLEALHTSKLIKYAGETAILGTIIDITDYKQAEELLKHKYNFEKTIADISSRFIGVMDFDKAINESLQDIGSISSASRVYLFLFKENEGISNNTYEWCAEGVETKIVNQQNNSAEIIHWYIDKLKKDKIINITNVSKLPRKLKREKKILKNQKIKSLLILPLNIGDELAGFLGFDNIAASREWIDNNLNLLRITSEIFGSVFERERAEYETEKHIQELKFLSKTAIEFTEFSKEKNIYTLIAERLKELIEDSIIIVNSFDMSTGLIYVKAISSFEKRTKDIEKILGFELIDSKYKVNNDDGRLALFSGKLIKGPNDIHEISFGRIPKRKSEIIEEKLQVKEIYVIGLTQKDELLGSATIIMCNGAKLKNQRIIEMYMREASIALQRWRAEEALRDSEKKYKDLFERSPEATLLINQDFQIIDCNDVAVKIGGIPRKDLIGAYFGEEIIPVLGEDKEEYFNLFWRAIDGETIPPFEVEITNRKGETYWLEANISIPEKYDEKFVLQIIAHDITDRKKANEELKNYQEHLQDLVEERTAQLQETNAELEAFAYSVSHDLRAPLRAMQGFASILVEDYSKQLDDTGKDYIQRIITASQQLNNMILDLLTYSRLSRAEMKLKPVSLRKNILEVVKQLDTRIKEKNVNIIIKPPLPDVIGDNTILTNVISNIISNAITFAKDNVRPKIKIWSEIENNKIRLYIEDNGIGIEPKYQEKIFRLFERLHGMESYPGTGLGLAIVKRGIERMKGNTSVKSKVGEGSTFWIELESVGKDDD